MGKRFLKSPKIHLGDTGLAAHLSGQGDAERLASSSALGPLLESFVVQELRKQLGWSIWPPMAYHFRTAAEREVDIVLEVPGGKVVGIGVKAAASAGRADFTGLRKLAQARRRATTSCACRAVSRGQRLTGQPKSPGRTDQQLWVR